MPEGKSKLYALEPIARKIPAVAKPKGHVHFRQKLLWTFGVLLLYFFLRNVPIYGLHPHSIDIFASFRAIMGGAAGSILQLGIGPLVTGSIIMQLFVGAKIFNLDLTNPDDRRVYQNVQRLMMVVMIVVEAVPQVFGYLRPSDQLIASVGLWAARAIIVIQIIIGGLLVMYMDEIVTKWGLGSGISLFILAGVSQAIFTGTFSWIPVNPSQALSINNPPSGAIPKAIYLFTNMNAVQLVDGGGFDKIFLAYPNPLVALIGTAIIFSVVVYAEGTRINIPVAHHAARGARGAFPIKLLYPSNIPVILITALLADLNAMAYILWTHPNIPFFGHAWWLGAFSSQSTRPIGGVLWYLNGPRQLISWLIPLLRPNMAPAYTFGHQWWQVLIQLFVYLGFMISLAVVFSILWVESTGMNPEAMARQILSGGLLIPGFRRSEKVIAKVLARYIPAVTVLGGMIVGLLAAFAQIIGTVGNVTGTGVLLAVSIAVRYAEIISKEQLAEMHPLFRRIFVGEE